ncbi:UNVERIFIED_CONTAM: hypothetical protein Sangu_0488000 [Sesamum angustifolium]|uniref:Transmembrane protein n=1 Tax=Sesamum angustifolium TaxID=2727405 RepID=A0AAW2Q808_9LAMI
MENDQVSEELDDWEHVQSPFSTVSANLIVDHENPVTIKDDFYSETSVFPPGNHEDLPVSPPQDDDQRLQEPEPVNLHPPLDGIRKWKRLHLGVIQTGIFHVADKVRKYVTCKVGVWLLAWTAGGVAAMVLVSILQRRVLIWWRRRMQRGSIRSSSKESLILVIREKDKKIDQLLLQMAQVNEILLARRRVPVIQVK